MDPDRADTIACDVAEQAAACRALTRALRARAARVRHRMPIEATNVGRWAGEIDAATAKIARAARDRNYGPLMAAWMNLRAAGVLIHAASTETSNTPCLTIFDDETIRTCSLTVADNADRLKPTP